MVMMVAAVVVVVVVVQAKEKEKIKIIGRELARMKRAVVVFFLARYLLPFPFVLFFVFLFSPYRVVE